jgi:FRG domain
MVWAMRIETVESWRELDEAIAEAGERSAGRHVHPTLVFRGLARADRANVSRLSRLGEQHPQVERHLIRNFRKYAHRESPGPTLWDWLALAQHHGLPTRLLDWTYSPQVALHFATSAWADEDAVLWAVDCDAVHRLLPASLRRALEDEGSVVFTTELLAEHAPGLPELEALSGKGDPFALFFEPPSLDERIVNQAAVLSVTTDVRCQMDEWLEGHPDVCRAWRLPPEVKAEVRARLDQANVTERILLPGLDGLAAWLSRYYAPRRIPVRTVASGGSMEERVDPQRDGSMS